MDLEKKRRLKRAETEAENLKRSIVETAVLLGFADYKPMLVLGFKDGSQAFFSVDALNKDLVSRTVKVEYVGSSRKRWHH